MTRTARRRFRIALYALCAMLLTQWTLAVHACPITRQPAQPAVPAPMSEHAALHSSMHGCPEFMEASEAVADVDAGGHVDAALCIKHCEDEGQVSGSSPMAAIDAPTGIAFRVALPAPRSAIATTAAPTGGDATAPPLIILYCVSLS